jgi:hypothetical protein
MQLAAASFRNFRVSDSAAATPKKNGGNMSPTFGAGVHSESASSVGAAAPTPMPARNATQAPASTRTTSKPTTTVIDISAVRARTPVRSATRQPAMSFGVAKTSR